MSRLLIALLATGLLGVSAASARSAHPDMTGLWVLTTGETPVIHEADVSLTPEGRARMQARKAQIAKGLVISEGHARCAPAGMPQMMSAPFALQIMQNSDRIVLNAEESSLPRTLYFRAKHPSPDILDLSWNGDSIAHWQGQTLIVDTIGFNDADVFDFNFDPPVKRTPALHLTERIHLEQGGNILVDAITLDDPTTFTVPAHVVYRYSRLPKAAGLAEYVCEPNVPMIQAYDAERPVAKPPARPGF